MTPLRGPAGSPGPLEGAGGGGGAAAIGRASAPGPPPAPGPAAVSISRLSRLPAIGFCSLLFTTNISSFSTLGAPTKTSPSFFTATTSTSNFSIFPSRTAVCWVSMVFSIFSMEGSSFLNSRINGAVSTIFLTSTSKTWMAGAGAEPFFSPSPPAAAGSGFGGEPAAPGSGEMEADPTVAACPGRISFC